MRPGIISAFAVAALSAFSAFAQLNPTVNVLTRPLAPVPGECEQGLAPAQARTLIAESAPQPAPPKTTAAPPSLDLKTRLRAVQAAAEQGNRDAFKSALADARAAIAAYPPGGERDAANDVLRVYEDLERLWDYAFTAPAGAFFDASSEDGALVKTLQRYPDYGRFIADSTLTVGGTVIYPTTESRQFLVAEASRRLGRLGVRMPERIAEVPKPVAAPAPVPAPTPTPAPVAAPKPSVSKPAVAHRQVTKPAAAKPARPAAAAPHEVSPKPKPIAEANAVPKKPRAPVAASPPAPQPTAQPTPMPQASPVTPAPAATSSGMPPAMETAPPATATTATTAPTTTNRPPQQGGRVNLLFAIILIVVGIGVLIVLLRASD